jgi:enoyl-CoA hydratase
MAESYECFKVDVADFVATVRLARPPVNAQNRRFREEIITIFDVLSDRPDVRAIVLTGEGKTFSAGADLKERPSLSQEIGAYPRHNRIVRESFNAVMECEKPVIAAINGAAIGAGCVLALCCDILIASEAGYLAMTEVDVGLAGGVSHVRRFFGESDARLLIYTARRMGGAELTGWAWYQPAFRPTCSSTLHMGSHAKSRARVPLRYGRRSDPSTLRRICPCATLIASNSPKR